MVASLAHPGGNATGFMAYEGSSGGRRGHRVAAVFFTHVAAPAHVWLWQILLQKSAIKAARPLPRFLRTALTIRSLRSGDAASRRTDAWEQLCEASLDRWWRSGDQFR